MADRTPFFVGNWKMNMELADGVAFVRTLSTKLPSSGCEIGIAPQGVLLSVLVEACRSTTFRVFSQNSGPAKSGAFTGENSPDTLKALGVSWTLLGHSERRHVFLENEELIQKRCAAALSAGLNTMVCVGETLAERKAGKTLSVIEKQLGLIKGWVDPARLALAYEPVWAIGTGETATPAQAQEIHVGIRGWMERELGSQKAHAIRILYGGSVKPDNAKALMGQSAIDGLLVGGASLDPNGFAEIIKNGLS